MQVLGRCLCLGDSLAQALGAESDKRGIPELHEEPDAGAHEKQHMVLPDVAAPNMSA